MSTDDKNKKTLTNSDIITDHPTGRRGFMGLMAAGGAVGASASVMPTDVLAQTRDGDNGALHDMASCPRGQGGVLTGRNDVDSGNITDTGNRGRGGPYC